MLSPLTLLIAGLIVLLAALQLRLRWHSARRAVGQRGLTEGVDFGGPSVEQISVVLEQRRFPLVENIIARQRGNEQGGPCLCLLTQDGIRLSDDVEQECVGVLEFGGFFSLVGDADFAVKEQRKTAEGNKHGQENDDGNAEPDGLRAVHAYFSLSVSISLSEL